ncbi:hypothetical protein ACJMK2_040939 [Sinanodonta woodiana]|uniref:Protein kinase domain-containing protein n=1 Tax=Sinanodonta woodiana TaxID=1069815 RepID=A0ABD3W5D8_SINWO
MTTFLNQCRDQPCVLSLVCEHTRSVFLCYQEILDTGCMSRLIVGTWVEITNKGTHVIYLEGNRFEQRLLDTIRKNFQQRKTVQNENLSGADNLVNMSHCNFSATRLREDAAIYDDCDIGVAEGDTYAFINNIIDKRGEDIKETVDELPMSESCPEGFLVTSEIQEKIYTRTLKSHRTSERQSKFSTVENTADSQSEHLSKVKHSRDISSSSRRNNVIGQKRFVRVSTLEPSEEVVGIHVWEPVCFPEDSSLHIPSMIPQAFNNTKDRDMLSRFILGRHIPACVYENNLTELAELLLCDCMIIKSETIDKIELICFRSSVLLCDQEQFIKASQFVFTSLLTNMGDGPTVRDLTYSFILLLSMVYLRALTNSTSSRQKVRFTRELLRDFVSQLSKRESQNNLGESSRGFIRGLEIFLRKLSCRIEKEDSILQMGDWDQALKRESNTKFLVEAVSKMDISEQIALTFLLINTLNRLGSSVLPLAGLLADIAPQIIAPYRKTNKEQKRAVSQTYRYLLARSCKHILLHQQLSNVSGKNELIEHMKKLIQLTMDTKDHVKEAVCDNFKSLVFHKNRDIRRLIISKTNVLENLKSASFEYVTHQLRQARLSLHAHSTERKKSDNLPAWAMHSGSMGSQEVDVWCLIPSNQCILDRFQEDYKDKADKSETDAALNTLETLRSLQRNGIHEHVVQLLAYQCLPMPLFFVVENPNGVNLLKYLIFRRENKEWLNYSQLAHIVSDSLRAIRYLHDNDVLHRDITTNQFKICPDSFHVMLENFRVSKITPNKQDLFYMADREVLAVRWLARESLLYDKFSVGTDIWMFGHFILEIFTHGCWPFTEHRDKETGDIMEMVIKGNLTPRHPPCVPDEIFKVILRCFDEEKERITTNELAQVLDEFISADAEVNGKGKESLRSVWTKSEQYPPISLAQKRKNYLPELTIPSVILSMKISGDTTYYNIFEGQNVEKYAITESDLVTTINQPNFLKRTADLVVTEQLSELAINNTIPNRQTLKRIMNIETIDISYESEGYMQMIYRYPLGCRLREFAIQTRDSLEVLEKLLQLAKCIQQFHRARWLVRCISARDVWIGQNGEVYFLRLSRACPMPADVEWVIGEPFEDRRHWMPPEILHSDYDKMYTTASDIYQFGMTAFEVYQILSLPDRRKASLSSVPLAHVSRNKLLDALHKGQHPPQPARCPDEMYQIMKRCWYRERIRRPGIDEIIERIMTIIESSRSKINTMYKRTKFITGIAEVKESVDSSSKSGTVICHEANQTKQLRRKSLGSTVRRGMIHSIGSNPDHMTCNTITYTAYDNCINGSGSESEGQKRLYENAPSDLSSHISYENESVDESPSLASRHDSVECIHDTLDDGRMNMASDIFPRASRSRIAVRRSSGYSGSNEDDERCYDNIVYNNTRVQGVKTKTRKRSKSYDLKTFSLTNQVDSDRNEYIGNSEDKTHEQDKDKYQNGIHYMNRARHSMPLPVIPDQTHTFFNPDDDEKHASSLSISKSPKSQKSPKSLKNQTATDEAYLYRDFDLESSHTLDSFENTGRDTSNEPIEGLAPYQTVHVYDYAIFGEDIEASGSDNNGYLEANTGRSKHQINATHSTENEQVDLRFNDGHLESSTMMWQHGNNAVDISKNRDESLCSIQDRRSSLRVPDISAMQHIGHTLGDGTTLYEIKDITDMYNLEGNMTGGASEKYKESRSNVENNESRPQSWPRKVFTSSSHRVADIAVMNTTGHTLSDGTTLYEIRDISEIYTIEENGASEVNK